MTTGSRERRSAILIAGVALLALLVSAGAATAGDWLDWRGPLQTGEATATGLISSWDRATGENVIWRQDFIGRSTPAVHDGRVFVTGRAGTGTELEREILSAFDAESGQPLWERTLTTQLTTVPYQRAGWASPVVDRETGYVYVQGVAGPLAAFDRDGNMVWERLLSEEMGRYSGYGGRTHTPLIDEDRLIVDVINSSWGQGPPRHRYYAFDKRTGDVIWISSPGNQPEDLNTTSNSVIAVIEGRRLLISGNADGNVYALEARTGEKVWEFQLSKRGINSSPVVVGDTVYIGHSEENVDEATLGRTVAIDATGSGDVTATHEKWRREIGMGFPSPMYHDGRLYVADNAANLFALDAATGETIWEHSLGTVGKSIPIWADGKIYVTEVNGNFHILQDAGSEVKVLDTEYITMPEGRYAEIYGSPAIAYGRIYFTTEEGIYSLGDEEKPFEISESAARPMPAEAEGSDQPATLLVVPADLTVGLGDRVDFGIRLYNELGRELGRVEEASWSLDGLRGEISSDGLLSVEAEGQPMAGHVVAKIGDLEGRARVRAFGGLPYVETFDDIAGRGRPWWIGSGRYQVAEREDGGKVLEKPVAPSGLLRSILFVGPDHLSGYTVQAEVKGGQQGRRRTDVGLVNQGYILDLLGNGQDLQIRSWSAEMRMAETIEFPWEMDTWYMMKLRVDREGEKAIVRGKVWKKGEPEPADWTITADDPLGNEHGAPGVIGYSPASVYWDNLEVTSN